MENVTLPQQPTFIPLQNSNILERLWAQYFNYMQNPFLAVGLLLLISHEVVYFGRSLPWAIIDQIPYFRKYKLQDAKIPSMKEYLECLQSVLLSHLFVEAVPIFGFYPVCEYFNISIGTPFPDWKTISIQVAAFFIFEDTWHYWGHRVLHTKLLYKRIHKQHHKYAAPFGLTAEYAHPVEVAFTGAGTVGAPILWAYFFGNLHLFTVLLWIVLRLLQAVDSHSGYEFPWSFNNIFPLWSGADHHDDHHKYFTGNYASSFRWWDYLMGTETKSTVKKRLDSKKKQ